MKSFSRIVRKLEHTSAERNAVSWNRRPRSNASDLPKPETSTQPRLHPKARKSPLLPLT